jgi:hypothetical protein
MDYPKKKNPAFLRVIRLLLYVGLSNQDIRFHFCIGLKSSFVIYIYTHNYKRVMVRGRKGEEKEEVKEEEPGEGGKGNRKRR